MPRPLKYLLWLILPFGIIHLLIVILRNKLYDWHILKVARLPRLVISVGNLQMGGTGKTPMAISLLTYLQTKGAKVAVLTRGYKRKSPRNVIISGDQEGDNGRGPEAIGDEPAIIFRRITNGILGVGGNRTGVGKEILKDQSVDIFLLDDGLQHRRLHRDLDICLIDVTRWHWHPFLFPFSYLRDVKGSLKRCHAVVMTKSGIAPDKAEALQDWISDKHGIPVFEGDLVPQALISARDGSEISLSGKVGQKVAAFCGIADPNYFFAMLKQIGMELVLEKQYPDHHNYTLDDLHGLEATINQNDTGSAITTEKDAVKLAAILDKDIFKQVELYFLKVELVIKQKEEFLKLIHPFVPGESFN
jgi:tetraacyldisaccharide 4'-kinase